MTAQRSDAVPVEDLAAASTGSRRVAIVGPDASSLVRLRGGLIVAITAQGHRVLALAPDLEAGTNAALAALGAETAGYPLHAGGVQPLAERRSVTALAAVFGRWRPDVVLGFGLKPMLLAAIAGRRCGATSIVPLVSTLAELAHGRRARPGPALGWMMRSAFKAAHAIVFHNADDAARLRATGLLPAGTPVHIVPGRGVDLAHFAHAPLPPLAPGLVFTMIARLETGKGVIEFCEAARRVRARAPATRFVLAGTASTSRDRVTPEVLARYGDCVEWVGWHDDVRPLLAQTHVFVLPSHAEGMPPALQEALAVGRPVITCDVPGCRETVDERVNGVLVAKQDAVALAGAMESFLKRPDLIPWMSRASRLKAERRFDANTINAGWLAILGLRPA